MIVLQESPAIKAAIESIRQKGETMLKTIKEEYWPLVQSMFNSIKGDLGMNIFGEEVEVLEQAQLISIAKQYMPKGCNEVVVLRKPEPECIILFVSFAVNRSLLEQNQNNYIIIKSAKLAEEVDALFKDSELIILK